MVNTAALPAGDDARTIDAPSPSDRRAGMPSQSPQLTNIIRRATASIVATMLVGTLACGSDSVAPSFPSTPTVSTALATGQQFSAIAAGYASVCALDRHGTAWCWGDDPTQPGAPLSYRTVPVAVAAPHP